MAKRRENHEIAPRNGTKRRKLHRADVISFHFPKCGKFLRHGQKDRRSINLPRKDSTEVIPVKAIDVVESDVMEPLPPEHHKSPPQKTDKSLPPKEDKPLPEVDFDDLIIVEQGMGRPDGIKATPNSKVTISYVCMSHENFKHFGQGTYKFRLGSGEVIQGLDRGVEGMRVRDVRRLIMPQSCRVGGTEPWRVPPGETRIVCQVTLTKVECISKKRRRANVE